MKDKMCITTSMYIRLSNQCGWDFNVEIFNVGQYKGLVMVEIMCVQDLGFSPKPSWRLLIDTCIESNISSRKKVA